MASSARERRKSEVPRVPGYTCPLEACSLAHWPLSRDLAVAAARRRGTGVSCGLLILAALGTGCGTAATGERRPTGLRTDDLPAPRRMTPDGPRVVFGSFTGDHALTVGAGEHQASPLDGVPDAYSVSFLPG